MENSGMVGGDLTRGFRNNYRSSMFSKWGSKNPAQEEVMFERGGYVGGLVNDGNTCFMNSVLQSLASSQTLLQFLDEEIIQSTKELENMTSEDSAIDQEQASEVTESSQEKASAKPSKMKTYGKRKKKLTRNAEKEAAASDQEPANVAFSATLKELLDKLNEKHHRDRPFFKTNKLLKTMSKAPNKSLILGYDQEDAQEFFQTILSELETNVKSLHEKPAERSNTPVLASDLSEEAMVGQNHLGTIGTVYLPTNQINPNSVSKGDDQQSYTPLKLITPLDGITAERIGCLQCGENGGIRYSVFSGLSLNLPSENIGSNLKLSQLLQNWSKPEIIEGVECNRCALNAVLEHLNKTLVQFETSETVSEKLVDAVKTRIDELENLLSKPVVDDEDYKKLHTENMVKRTSKSKQILISRPPPLLCIHINRSVFDPRTYTIRKNNSRVLFKSKLNLAPWCCDIDEINLDARLPMSKKDQQLMESSEDENVGGEYFARLHRHYEEEFDDSDEEEESFQHADRDVSDYDPLKGELVSSSEDGEESEESDFEVDKLGNRIYKPKQDIETNDQEEDSGDDTSDNDAVVAQEPDAMDQIDAKTSEDEIESLDEDKKDRKALRAVSVRDSVPSSSTVPVGPLTYALRSVIVHYGTHNYGHYIAFRKFRGLWWRISDETVYVVEEEEVLSTPGVFMMFYEYDYNDVAQKLNDDIEWSSQADDE